VNDILHDVRQLQESPGIGRILSGNLVWLNNDLDKKQDKIQKNIEAFVVHLRKMESTLRAIQDEIKKSLIMKALWFHNIDSRFRDIHDSELGTFRWLLDDPSLLYKREPCLKLHSMNG
jgi:hypothetical protein